MFLCAVVVICGGADFLRQVMGMAATMGMTNGDFVFIFPTIIPVDNFLTLWQVMLLLMAMIIVMISYDYESTGWSK